MSGFPHAQLLRARGVVQGVGFRPFVYSLATQLALAGCVRNTSSGVEIALEGPAEALAEFRRRLTAEPPALAQVEEVVVEEAEPASYAGFAIHESKPESGVYQLVSPDTATCEDCRRELFDPHDRRYRYPFTNCTNCGPRYTIINDIPYDRPLTTMAAFPMCARCRAEYEDPRNRRFHAQPNACPECGPHVWLATPAGESLAEREAAIKAVRQALAAGQVVALKGLGGFHLACDATSEAAVARLRRRKVRPHKPLAVMVASLETAARLGEVGPSEAALLTAPQRPIVLLSARKDSPVAPNVAPGTGTIGVMLPYTPLHHLILEPAAGFPLALVMTSGNLSEEPIAMENDEALQRLGHIAGLFLLHNRGISARYDDSVWAVVDGVGRPVRRARGYAPFPVKLPFRGPQVLACGPELKNTFCYTRDEYAFLSPHIGNLENLETLDHYARSLDHYRRLFRLQPQVVACDMHPEYLATKLARERWGSDPGMTLVWVQHHHAHIAACLVEHGERGPAIGVALDGTGYGTDGHIWGGEFLVADLAGFRRAGRLAEFPLPGGEAAIHRPYRTALGLVLAAGMDPAAWPSLAALPAEETAVVSRQVAGGLNAPITSSAGRLFDAIAALIGVRGDTSYEAQAAIELEAMAAEAGAAGRPYPFDLRSVAGAWVLDWRPLLRALLADVRAGAVPECMAARFHAGVAAAIVETVGRIAASTGLRTVALSGGCFQNRVLLAQTAQALRGDGYRVLAHHLVPANDGGVALGQAAVAAARMMGEPDAQGTSWST
ncbi:MAG TPA: carbamoyltransferase HypF [Anaerolineae bacterium]|nr:carbamoyltransferase HypF [Anaerolineae bacterium]